jgi:hypothetical protein
MLNRLLSYKSVIILRETLYPHSPSQEPKQALGLLCTIKESRNTAPSPSEDRVEEERTRHLLSYPAPFSCRIRVHESV